MSLQLEKEIAIIANFHEDGLSFKQAKQLGECINKLAELLSIPTQRAWDLVQERYFERRASETSNPRKLLEALFLCMEDEEREKLPDISEEDITEVF